MGPQKCGRACSTWRGASPRRTGSGPTTSITELNDSVGSAPVDPTSLTPSNRDSSPLRFATGLESADFRTKFRDQKDAQGFAPRGKVG